MYFENTLGLGHQAMTRIIIDYFETLGNTKDSSEITTIEVNVEGFQLSSNFHPSFVDSKNGINKVYRYIVSFLVQSRIFM